jgi:hypothetical protein
MERRWPMLKSLLKWLVGKDKDVEVGYTYRWVGKKRRKQKQKKG